MPLAGRLSDRHGRISLIIACLTLFAIGSMVTAAAYNLPLMIAGRSLQGAGAGGLIPVTLALVADTYVLTSRGVALGAVGAVQEAGALLGPMAGAAVVAFTSWRTVFWLGLLLAGILIAALLALGNCKLDWIGLFLAICGLTLAGLTLVSPVWLTQSVAFGTLFIPVVGSSRLMAPMGLAAAAFLLLLIVRRVRSVFRRSKPQGWTHLLGKADFLGAGLLAIALGALVLTFARADPAHEAVAPNAPLLVMISAVFLAAFIVRQRTARDPLIPVGTLQNRQAWGALAVNLLVGGALIAILIDVPIYVRLVDSNASQFSAALVLMRFVVAVLIGTIVGGWLVRHINTGSLVAVGLMSSTGALLVMSSWNATAVHGLVSAGPLLVAGSGFGLVIAPLNTILLAITPDDTHGIASALLIVTRMIGMLIGISVLTAVALHRYELALHSIPSPAVLCPATPMNCSAYVMAIGQSALIQVHSVFAGAAVCAGTASVLAASLLRRRSP
jgi:MFS family permease